MTDVVQDLEHLRLERRERPSTVNRSVSGGEFRHIVSAFPTGVTVISTRDDAGTSVGLCANAVTSVSLDPPLLLVCLAEGTYTLRAIVEHGAFAVNFLAGAQEDVARLFASKAADKFASLPHRVGDLGVPLIDGCAAVAECAVHGLVQAGDHTIVVGRVVAGSWGPDEPLVYYRHQFGACPTLSA